MEATQLGTLIQVKCTLFGKCVHVFFDSIEIHFFIFIVCIKKLGLPVCDMGSELRFLYQRLGRSQLVRCALGV